MAIRSHTAKSGKTTHYVVVWDKRTNTQQYVGSFTKLRDAKDAESSAYKRINATRPAKPELITIGELAERFMASRDLRPESVHSYNFDLRWIKEFFGEDRRVVDITLEDIELFAKHMRPKLAAQSRRKVIVRLMQMLKKAHAWGYINYVPSVEVRKITSSKREREPRVFTKSEMEAIVKAAPERFKTMFYIWPMLGLRVAEIRALRVEDIDFSNRVVHVRGQVRADKWTPLLKTDTSERDVFMPDNVAQALRAFIDTYKPAKFLWPAAKSERPLCEKLWRKVWDDTVVASHIGDFRSHDFRHTFGALLFQQGADVLYVRDQMGHASASTTLNIYGDRADKHDRDSADKLGEFFGELHNPVTT